MHFANSDLLFEDSKLLADGPSLARPEGIQSHSTNETERSIVATVALDRKTTLQSKESARIAVERANQVITRARAAIIILFSRGQHVINRPRLWLDTPRNPRQELP
jgi:hypothetical protein